MGMRFAQSLQLHKAHPRPSSISRTASVGQVPAVDTAQPLFAYSIANIPIHPKLSRQERLPIQRKLSVGSVHDPLESEANSIASNVMSMDSAPAASSYAKSEPLLRRKCKCSGNDKCDECGKQEPPLQRKAANSITSVEVPPIVHEELRSPGHPLDSHALAFFEPRFQASLGRVRLHTGPRAAESADVVHAHAFTVGNHIVFNSGCYAPATTEGKHLLAHELTHVLQQTTGPRALRRQPQKGEKDDDSKSKQPAGPNLRLYTVRDKRLQLGGTLVSDLEKLKQELMAKKDTGEWTLVIAMHGSQDRLGAQAPPDWQKDAKFYDAAAIDSLFNDDKAWTKWRDQHGPTQMEIVGCQVSKSFEGNLISNFTRIGSKGRQPAQGLGEGCKPIASTVTLDDAPPTLAEYNKLSPSRQQTIFKQLSDLNDKWGYYGAPPVPSDQIMHYYYDEEPKAAWVKVEVMVGKGHEADELKKTNIPFWNRTTGPDSPKFRDLCDQGAAPLHGHTPVAPPDPDE